MAFVPKSDFLNAMMTRGFFHDCSDAEGLDQQLLKGIVPAYIGFDATAKSLHAGSLIQIMMLRWLQKTGHQPIVLMGGGTTKVGDPSFRADERPLLNADEINANIQEIQKVFAQFITFGSGPSDAVMANNADWLDGLNYIEFLRDIGRHFSVNRMLSFESVKSRMDREQSLSFLEFNYMILQAYDFLELARRNGCLMQMGGSDQWGNILNGVDLTRRLLNRQVFALTSPLLTTSDGKKMGKTAGGAVWLNADLYSPYDFWQYWRNIDDADVGHFLKLYTELSLDECDRLGKLRDAELNEAKIILANEITSLTHGREAANKAHETASRVFGEGNTGTELPTLVVTESMCTDGGYPLTKALLNLGFVASGKEAKRNILGRGVRINNQIEIDTSKILVQGMGPIIKLSLGRKRHAQVMFED